MLEDTNSLDGAHIIISLVLTAFPVGFVNILQAPPFSGHAGHAYLIALFPAFPLENGS